MKGFAKYKQSLDSILENSYTNKKEFKNNLSVIMGTLKFSKPLREFFTLYNEIEIKNFETVENSKNYLNEAVRHLRENKKELQNKIAQEYELFNECGFQYKEKAKQEMDKFIRL